MIHASLIMRKKLKEISYQNYELITEQDIDRMLKSTEFNITGTVTKFDLCGSKNDDKGNEMWVLKVRRKDISIHYIKDSFTFHHFQKCDNISCKFSSPEFIENAIDDKYQIYKEYVSRKGYGWNFSIWYWCQESAGTLKKLENSHHAKVPSEHLLVLKFEVQDLKRNPKL